MIDIILELLIEALFVSTDLYMEKPRRTWKGKCLQVLIWLAFLLGILGLAGLGAVILFSTMEKESSLVHYGLVAIVLLSLLVLIGLGLKRFLRYGQYLSRYVMKRRG